MTLRTFTRHDPEPDDHPDVIDEQGCLWIYDQEGDEENGIFPGWIGLPGNDIGPCSWRDLFVVHGCTTLDEMTPDEVDEYEREIARWEAS